MGHVDLRDAVDVRSAAERLGLSTPEIRRLIREGEVTARSVAGRWLVPTAEIRRHASLDRPVGRPYDPQSAWTLLELLDGRAPEGLSSVRRSQFRRVLRDADPDALAARLRRRADRRMWYGHPSVVDGVLADERVAPTAWSRVEELDIDVVAGDERVAECYVASADLPDLAREFGLEPADVIANLVLRVVPDRLPEGGLPVSAVALDLLESGDPRGVDAARRAWRRIITEYRAADA